MSDNEMLKLADEIDINNRIGADHKFSDEEAVIIQRALRAAAASAEPVAREAVAACLDCLKLETYRPDDASADYAVTIVGQSKAVDAIMSLYTHPAPDAEIVSALEAMCGLFDDEGNLRERAQDQISVALESTAAALAKAKGGSRT